MKSYFVHNGPVKIHVLDNETATGSAPALLVIGGLWEPAERAMPILSGLSTHVIALSLRGRGLSSTPAEGYDLADHLSDIEAVVKYCQLCNYCVLGFSRGASYALGWSLENQRNMYGLILVDQPPVHIKPGPGYVDFWSNLVYQGIPIINYMRPEVLEGLSKEATEIDFSSELSKLKIPVAFFAGRNVESYIPSDITEETIQFYKSEIPSCEIVEFHKSGHMIPDDEPEKYLSEITSFIERIRN